MRPFKVKAGLLSESWARWVRVPVAGGGSRGRGVTHFQKLGQKLHKFHFHQLLTRPGESHCGNSASEQGPPASEIFNLDQICFFTLKNIFLFCSESRPRNNILRRIQFKICSAKSVEIHFTRWGLSFDSSNLGWSCSKSRSLIVYLSLSFSHLQRKAMAVGTLIQEN